MTTSSRSFFMGAMLAAATPLIDAPCFTRHALGPVA